MHDEFSGVYRPGKGRPSWRAALHAPTNRNPEPPTATWHFGAVPDCYRCKAMARSTGMRCRLPRMRGAPTCAKHGGHVHAYRAERLALGNLPLLTLPPIRGPRRALATLGTTVPKSVSQSIIERGRWLERALNGASNEVEPGTLQKV